MKNSQVFYILLFAANLFSSHCTPQLDKFLKSVREAQPDLQHLSFEDSHSNKRSASINEILGRFERDYEDAELSDSDLEGGDAWYQSFRAMECQHGGCQKKPLRWKTKKSEMVDYYEDYEEPDSIDLSDQFEQTQNDLSHEANYKLSKVEQDAVEKSLPKSAWPVRHPSKRSPDPVEEVKLKTSLRMLQNGEGPSLPSSIYAESPEKYSVEDIVADSKHKEGSETVGDSYEVLEGRKLLFVSDYDDTVNEEEICGAKDCWQHPLDMQQFDNIKEKTQLDRELEGLTFDNMLNDIKKIDENKGTITSLSDELMHSQAFLKLEKYLRGITNKTTTTTTKKPSAAKKTTTTKKPSGKKTTTTTKRPKVAAPLSLGGKNSNVNIKLHMSVNATVAGDGKLPQQFRKNSTVNFNNPTNKPSNSTSKSSNKISKGGSMSEEDLNRESRSVVFPIITSSNKRKTTADRDIAKSVIQATENFPLDELITGKLSSELVKTIFALVRTSPNLKVLWPGLKGNKVASAQQVQNFYAIRNHDNESEMQRTELMLRQAMETINAIIEQQVRSRSCVPLRADLKAFYNLILKTRAENDRLQDRPKRETTPEESSLSGTQVRHKSRIVKKLLRDYEELPREDQDQVVGIKENLLKADEQLEELKQRLDRRKRHLLGTYNMVSSNATSYVQPNDMVAGLTPQFMKLARTAEKLYQNSITDDEFTLDFDFI